MSYRRLIIWMRVVALAVPALILSSCTDPDERYDVGYDDGYAVGYNSTCEIRTTLIEGDFDNSHYQRGYDDGYRAGSEDCRRSRD